MNLVAEQWVEGRADGQRLLEVEAGISNSQSHQCVDAPCVKAPVKEGVSHRFSRSQRGFGFGDRWGAVVGDGFSDAPEDQPYAHTGAEEHGKPREAAELGLRLFAANADISLLGEADIKNQDQKNINREYKKPASRIGHRCFQTGKQLLCLFC